MTTNLQLLNHRLHWYRSQMLVKLFRIKYALLIFIMLFIQTVEHFKFLITKPILAVTDSVSISFLIAIQLVYLAWVVLQHDAIQPSHVKTYLTSLPISLFLNRLINFMMLLVAMNILWLPFVATFFISLHKLNLLALVVSILIAQLLWLDNKILSLASIILFDVFAYFTHSFLLSMFVAGLFLLINPSLVKNRINVSINFKFLSNRFPLFTLQWVTLWRQYRIEIVARSLLCLGIIFFSYAIIVYGGAVNSASMTMIVAPSIMLIFSGCYPLLKETRLANALYLNSLPFSKAYWFALDYMVLMLIAFIFTLLLEVALLFKHQLQLITLFYLFLMLPVGLILVVMRDYFVKHGTWITTFFTIVFILFMLSTVSGY